MESCPHIIDSSKKPFEDLMSEIKSGRCVAWIGSGPSQSTGQLPSWPRLCCHLGNACGLSDFENFDISIKANQRDQTIADRCNSVINDAALTRQEDPSDAEFLIRIAQDAFNASPKNYERVLLDIFAVRNIPLPETYSHLANVCFKSIITTNFDYTLIRACKYCDNLRQSGRVFHGYPKLPVTDVSNSNVFHLHGVIEEGSDALGSIVLKTTDFQNAYGSEGSMSAGAEPVFSFLSKLLVECSVCLIGADPRDPGFHRAMGAADKYMRAFAIQFGAQNNRPHIFRLKEVPRGTIHPTQDSSGGVAGFIDVYYEESNREYVELRDIAKFMSDQCPAAVRRDVTGFRPSGNP